LAAAVGLMLAIGGCGTAAAQKQGGILRIYHRDSPASMSIHEEGTYSVITPMMPVFNNLVLFDQHVPQNSLASIVPELATSWAWNEDGTALTFKLRHGVKWHDGKPLPPPMSNAPGTCCSTTPRTSSASTTVRPGISTSLTSPPTAMTRRSFI